MTIRTTRRAALVLSAAALLALAAGGDEADANESAKVFQTDEGVAVNGYDVVGYFEESEPVEGSAEFTAEHAGATWHFASAGNRDAFKADPAKYAPAYGGYCAYAVAKGSTATTVPDAWKIVDGTLYLNFSKDVQSKWEEDIPGYIEQADANWPGVLE